MAGLFRAEVPMRVLRIQTRKNISDCLNVEKIFKTDKNLCRDWRGLADCCGVKILIDTNTTSDPTGYVIREWQKQEPEGATVEKFKEFLKRMDRYDIIDDLEDSIRKDVERYRHVRDTIVVKTIQKCPNNIPGEVDSSIITIDDVCRIEKGLDPQMYHALVVYSDDNFKDVEKIVNTLESKGIKLCIKDRDLVAGVEFEYNAMKSLVEDRCHKLIAIVGPNFMNSPMNIRICKHAAEIQIKSSYGRKLVPIVYPGFKLPDVFNSMICLKMDERTPWFWPRLLYSVTSMDENERIKYMDITPEETSNQPTKLATIEQSLLLPMQQPMLAPKQTIKSSDNVTSDKSSLDSVSSGKNGVDLSIGKNYNSNKRVLGKSLIKSISKMIPSNFKIRTN